MALVVGCISKKSDMATQSIIVCSMVACLTIVDIFVYACSALLFH